MKRAPKKRAPKKTARPAPLAWKHGRRDRLETSDRMTWASRCGRFKVERLDSLYGLPRAWIAVAVRPSGGEFVLYRGRSRRRAETACRAAQSWLEKIL